MKIAKIFLMACFIILLSSLTSFAAFVMPTLSNDELDSAATAVIALSAAYVIIKMVIGIIREGERQIDDYKLERKWRNTDSDESWKEYQASQGRDADGNFIYDGTFIGPTGPDENDADDRRNYN